LATNPFWLDLRGENQGRKCDFLLQDHGQHVQYYGHVFFVSWEDQLAAWTRAERGQKINFHMGKTQNFCRKKHRFVWRLKPCSSPIFKKKSPLSRNVKRCRFCYSTRIRFPYWITLNFISVPFFQFSYFCQFAPFPLNLFQSWPDRIKICPWFLDWSFISPWFFDYSFLSLTPNFNFLFSVKLLIDLLN